MLKRMATAEAMEGQTRNQRNCALYYERHKHAFLRRKLLRSMQKGTIPYRRSCQLYGVSVKDVIDAYALYSKDNEPSARSRERYERLLREWC